MILVRLLPVVLLMVVLAFWFDAVEKGGPYVLRNLLPPFVVVLLCILSLVRGKGRWSGAGWRLPLGTLGYAVPALGLSAYLHYAFAVNLNDMFTDPEDPGDLFRFLPVYTLFAGGIGFAIGWIIGRNL